jgi:hypothetical protein
MSEYEAMYTILFHDILDSLAPVTENRQMATLARKARHQDWLD